MTLQPRLMFLPALVLYCLVTRSGVVTAQTPASVPVPSPFASAHTAFLAQAGAPAVGNVKLGANIIYDSMYRSLSEGKLFTLTTSPADADLTMEILALVVVGVANTGFNTVLLRLIVRDRKTQALLWVFDEPLEGAFREKTFKRNVDSSSVKIVDNLKLLSQGLEPKP